MRFLLGFLLLATSFSSAHATIISFSPAVGIAYPDFANFVDFENLTIISSSTSTATSGSGRADSELYDWHSGRIEVSLGEGAGSASASLLSVATFDLVFDSPRRTYVVPFIGVNGPFSVDAGDFATASWDIFLDIDGELFGESQGVTCSNPIDVDRFCGNFFDSSEGLFQVRPGKDLRVPVRATMRFDLSASRVSEPNVLIVLLGVLAWLMRRAEKGRRRIIPSSPNPVRSPSATFA